MQEHSILSGDEKPTNGVQSPALTQIREVEDQNLPFVTSTEKAAFLPIIERLADTPIGKYLAFSVSSDLSRAEVRKTLAYLGRKNQFILSVRFVGDQVFAAVKKLLPKLPSRFLEKKDRNLAILEALTEGHTYQEISDRHGITRERVRQIRAAGDFRELAPQYRVQASIELLKPYLETVRNSEHPCPFCAKPIGNSPIACRECREYAKVLRDIRAQLLSWDRDNTRQQARLQCVYLIRKYNIKPEHLAPKETL